MEVITHKSVFELFAVDMEIPPSEIKHLLIEKGAECFLLDMRRDYDLIDKIIITLNSPIYDKEGTKLLNENIVLNKFLFSILERYTKDSKFETSHIEIVGTEEIQSFYRSKILTKFIKFLISKVYSNQEMHILYQRVVNVKVIFQNLILQLLKKPKGINILLNLIFRLETHEGFIRKSVYSSMISLGLTDDLKIDMSESQKTENLKLALLCFLKDYDDIVEKEGALYKLIDFIFDEDPEVANSLEIYRNNITKQERLFSEDSKFCRSRYLKNLITISSFLDMCTIKFKDPLNVELHKYLNMLADDGFNDIETAFLIGKLFLPETKILMLNKALTLKRKCKNQTSFIWQSAGDMLPTKLICRNTACANNGRHKTFITKDICIGADDQHSMTVEAGIYYTCERLTAELQEYYRELLKGLL